MSSKLKFVGSIDWFESTDSSGLIIHHVPSYTTHTIIEPALIDGIRKLETTSGELSDKDAVLLFSESMLPFTSFLFENGILRETQVD